MTETGAVTAIATSVHAIVEYVATAALSGRGGATRRYAAAAAAV